MNKIKVDKLKIIFNLAYWDLFITAIQYYMLFPAKFTNALSDEFNVVSPDIKIERCYYNGDTLKSIYFSSKHENPALIVFLHGNFETIDQNIMDLIRISKSEFDILMVEYPGYGSSTGWPTPTNILASNLSAIKKYKKEHQKLILWGRSLGGANAVNLATVINYDKLILESTFLHPLNYIGNNLFSSLLKTVFVFNLDSENKFHLLKSPESPILLIHGKEDHMFDVEISHQMKNQLNQFNVSQIIHNGGHNQRHFDKSLIYNYLSVK